jgi:hypothetical protein
LVEADLQAGSRSLAAGPIALVGGWLDRRQPDEVSVGLPRPGPRALKIRERSVLRSIAINPCHRGQQRVDASVGTRRAERPRPCHANSKIAWPSRKSLPRSLSMPSVCFWARVPALDSAVCWRGEGDSDAAGPPPLEGAHRSAPDPILRFGNQIFEFLLSLSLSAIVLADLLLYRN